MRPHSLCLGRVWFLRLGLPSFRPDGTVRPPNSLARCNAFTSDTQRGRKVRVQRLSLLNPQLIAARRGGRYAPVGGWKLEAGCNGGRGEDAMIFGVECVWLQKPRRFGGRRDRSAGTNLEVSNGKCKRAGEATMGRRPGSRGGQGFKNGESETRSNPARTGEKKTWENQNFQPDSSASESALANPRDVASEYEQSCEEASQAAGATAHHRADEVCAGLARSAGS